MFTKLRWKLTRWWLLRKLDKRGMSRSTSEPLVDALLKAAPKLPVRQPW